MGKRVNKQDMQATDLQKLVLSMSGRYSAYEVFMDFIECSALAVANSLSLNDSAVRRDREEQYLRIAKKYTEKERENLSLMMAYLVEELERDPRDVLGEVFMRSGMGSDAHGQFFTPYHISRLMSEISVSIPEEGEKITMNEPSCGSGGGIIAAAVSLHKRGVNYQNLMKVVAQDVDWRCVYMCYLQLSFMGIDAICVQGNTLLDPYRKGAIPENRILRTPKAAGALL